MEPLERIGESRAKAVPRSSALLPLALAGLSCGPAGGSSDPESQTASAATSVTVAEESDTSGVSTDTHASTVGGTETSDVGTSGSSPSTGEIPACTDGDEHEPDCGDCQITIDPAISLHGEAARDGLRTVPFGPRIVLPSPLSEHLDDPRYAFLSADALPLAREGAGEWNSEYARVANDVIDYAHCTSHLGTNTWPAGEGWHSTYLRVYVVPQSVAEIEAKIGCVGPASASAVGGLAASVSSSAIDDWRRTRLSFGLTFDDYGGTAVLDFVMREYCDATVVLLFMYPLALPSSPEEAIIATADSACLVGSDGSECCAG